FNALHPALVIAKVLWLARLHIVSFATQDQRKERSSTFVLTATALATHFGSAIVVCAARLLRFGRLSFAYDIVLRICLFGQGLQYVPKTEFRLRSNSFAACAYRNITCGSGRKSRHLRCAIGWQELEVVCQRAPSGCEVLLNDTDHTTNYPIEYCATGEGK